VASIGTFLCKRTHSDVFLVKIRAFSCIKQKRKIRVQKCLIEIIVKFCAETQGPNQEFATGDKRGVWGTEHRGRGADPRWGHAPMSPLGYGTAKRVLVKMAKKQKKKDFGVATNSVFPLCCAVGLIFIERAHSSRAVRVCHLFMACAVNVNFFMMSAVLPHVSTNYIARAAQCLHNVARCRCVVCSYAGLGGEFLSLRRR